MYTTKFISSDEELKQVAEMSRMNSEDYITNDIKATQGYTSWKYTFEDLKALHEVSPSVVVKDGDSSIKTISSPYTILRSVPLPEIIRSHWPYTLNWVSAPFSPLMKTILSGMQ